MKRRHSSPRAARGKRRGKLEPVTVLANPPSLSGQLTVRNVPPQVEKALRRKAAEEKKSLNGVLVEALTQAAGLSPEGNVFTDLDCLAGIWVEDPAFDEAIRLQDTVDEETWS